jgi:hypothetical protein
MFTICPVVRRNHVRQKRFRAVDNPPEVNVHDPLDVLEFGLLDVTVVRDPGVVVHLVHPAEVCHDIFRVGQHSLPLRDVEPVGLHLRAQPLSLAHRLRQTFHVDIRQRQLRALPCEIQRQRPADA